MKLLKNDWRQWWSRVDWEMVRIFLKSSIAIGLFLYFAWWIHINVMSPKISQVPLSLAVSFIGAQVAVITAQLMASAGAKKIDEVRAHRAKKWRPVIQRYLAVYVAGNDRTRELRFLRWLRASDFEGCLVPMLSSLRGASLDRLSELARDLGIIQRWVRFSRRGRAEHKRAQEWLSLLSEHVGGKALDEVASRRRMPTSAMAFRMERAARVDDSTLAALLEAPVFARTMVSGSLSPHLSRSLDVAAQSSERAILAALELARAWQRTIDTPSLEALLMHPSEAVRAGALNLLTLQAAKQTLAVNEIAQPIEIAQPMAQHGTTPKAARTSGASLVMSKLAASEGSTRAAAMAAAGRMRLEDAALPVEQMLHSDNESLVRLACQTLASLGPSGRDILAWQIAEGPRETASQAAESLMAAALDHARPSR